jgi:acyl-coenzyme A thioesterase PaaI-like protein
MNMPAVKHPLDEATTLEVLEPGYCAAHTSAAYWNMNGPFGGVTTALMLRAAGLMVAPPMEVVALTVNFCAPQSPGRLFIAAREVRRGRWTSHVTLQMQADDATVVATATAVFGLRQPTFAKQLDRMPAVPPAKDLPSMAGDPRFAWLQQYDFRFVEGTLQLDGPADAPSQASAASMLWVRDRVARPLDRLSLVALCDSFFLRIFHLRQRLTLAGTVTLTAHLHASDEDLARQGERHVLGWADASVFTRNFFDQRAQLWGDDGTLLATSTQLAWFKE